MINLKDIRNKMVGNFQGKDSLEENPTEKNKSAKSPEEIINSFLEDTPKWEAAYSSQELFATISRFAKKAGVTTIYYALLLFQAIMSDKISSFEKTLAIAALGYFISPLDIIPDFLPGGLFDDSVILFYGIDKLSEAIDSESEYKAREQLSEWFCDSEIIEISKDDIRILLKIKDLLNPIKAPIKILKLLK